MYFYLYSDWAKEILKSIGKCHRIDDVNDDRSDVEQACVYEGYGLKIISTGLPGYVDSDVTKGYIKDVRIYYLDRLVFDSKNENLCKSGIWEEIFDELHNKHETIHQTMIINKANCKTGDEVYKEIIDPLRNFGVKKVNDYLMIKSERINGYRTNNCGTFLDSFYCNVIYNGKSVFGASREEDELFYHCYHYEPGEWVYELEECLDNKRREKEREREEKGEEYLKLLRKL